MSDPNFFLIDYEIIRHRHHHLGFIGKGRDIYLEIPCTIHLLEDKMDQKKRALQIFHNLQQDLLQKKIEQLTKAAYLFFVPFSTSIIFLSLKPNDDKSTDLAVVYDFEKIDKSLQEIAQQKQQEKQSFTEEEIWQMLRVLLDTLHMGSRLSGEFLDFSPENIYISQELAQKFVVTNFGIVQPKKFEMKLHCPNDRFFHKNYERSYDSVVRATMFKVGMLALYMGTLIDPNSYYNDIYNTDVNQIDSAKLQSGLQKFQEKFGEKLSSLIGKLITIREEERLDLDELMRDKADELLNRDLKYYQGSNISTGQMYSGFVKVSNEQNIPNGAGDIFTEDGEYYKGLFKDGNYDGLGIWHDGEDILLLGNWVDKSVKVGFEYVRNEFLYIGEMGKNGKDGNGILISLTSNTSANFHYFEGQFENGEPTKGTTFYKDQKFYEGPPDYGKKIEIKPKDIYKVQRKKGDQQTFQMAGQSADKSQSMKKKQLGSPIKNDSQFKYSKSKKMDTSKIQKKQSQFKGQGTLYINIVAAQNIKNNDLDASDPYCEVELSKGSNKKIRTSAIDDQWNPIWQHKESIKINITENDSKELKLTACIFDQNIAKDELIAKLEIDISEYFLKPGTWLNKYLNLYSDDNKPNGQLYIQLQWRPLDLQIFKRDPTNLLDPLVFSREKNSKTKQDIQSVQKSLEKNQKSPQKSGDISGNLAINIISAHHLKQSDFLGKSDPYCELELYKGDKLIKSICTNYIESDLNPKWEKKDRIKISRGKDEIKDMKLKATVYDYDYNQNDFLGSVDIPLAILIEKPGQWINQLFTLNNEKQKPTKSQIYLQFQWRPQDIVVDLKEPKRIK